MVRILKKFIFKAYVIGLMVFTVWYGYFMYPLIFGFEGKEAAGISLKQAVLSGTEEEQMFKRMSAEKLKVRKSTDLGYRLIDQPYIKGRFHHIGFTIKQDKSSTCTLCHGNAPHASSKETRSFLNMHSFYLACETCHSVPEKDEVPWKFGWYNKDTGELSGNPKALLDIENSFKYRQEEKEYMIYGDYGVKIAPGTSDAGKISLLHNEKDMAMVEDYIEQRSQLNPDQKSERIDMFHRKTSEHAVTCSSCHTEQGGYIPFAELGYPPTRLGELTNNPIVGMLQKYKEFHF